MIRLACADNTFRLVQPWESAVEIIRLLELDGVDVCLMGNRSHLRPEDVRDDLAAVAARITKALLARGLAVSDLFCIPWTDFERFAPNHPDPEERARSRALFEDMLELAVRIEAPGLTMLPGVDWENGGHSDSFDRSVDELSRRAGLARTEGLRFSIEPHFGSIARTPRPRPSGCAERPRVSSLPSTTAISCIRDTRRKRSSLSFRTPATCTRGARGRRGCRPH